jgi:NAD(P)-dependent dehydrogenase (short-subunit alcohol dehydrogenase family)
MSDPEKDLTELLRIDGRTAVVIGGCGHIGRAIADALAEMGASVAIVDREVGMAESVAKLISERRNTLATWHEIDLEKDDAVGLKESVLSLHDRVDVLVHAAALVGTSGLSGWTTAFEDQSVDSWRRALEVNLTSVFSVTQAFAAALREGRRGAIVTIGSIYGAVGVDLRLYNSTGMGSPAAYAASKGGLLQLTRWLATVLAPDIRVNAVSPGGVWRQQPEEFVREYERRTPLGRLATEADIKGAVAFLASDASAYITGQNLLVDGGWTAW